jgi:hypothetical protein
MLDRDGNFIGFAAPQYTQVPDELFDELLASLSGPETKVLLYLVRRTFGFKRDSDAISLNQMLHGLKTRDGRQLDRGVGLSKPTIVKALKELESRRIIVTRRERQADGAYVANTYALNVIRDGKPNLLPQESQLTTPSEPALLPPVKALNPQETVVDRTDEYTVSQQEPTVAVVASLVSCPNALSTALQELGLKPSVAAELIRTYDPAHIARMIEFVVYKLRSGWRPKESVPAWLVTAIREAWSTPAYFTTAAERRAAEGQARCRRAAEQIAKKRAEEAEKAAARERQERLRARLGVQERIQALWEQAQRLLQERGQWTVALVDAHLVERGGQYVIVVPFEFAQRRIEEMRERVEDALSEVVGHATCVAVECDAEAFREP